MNSFPSALEQLSKASESSQAKHGHVHANNAGSAVVSVVARRARGLVTTIAALQSLLVVAGALLLALDLVTAGGVVEELAEIADIRGRGDRDCSQNIVKLGELDAVALSVCVQV